MANESRMPVVFAGHGSPLNAIAKNRFSAEWERLGRELPKPQAIVVVSAHWEEAGSSVTAMERPPTIHDFGGFPDELYRVQYPAPGEPRLASELRALLSPLDLGLNLDWGLDHGAWSLLKAMHPKADIPVLQLSMDRRKAPRWHYELGARLQGLRDRGILLLCSGNIVHNLRRIAFKPGEEPDFDAPYGLDWALEADALFRRLMDEDRIEELCSYPELGEAARLAVPTNEHFLPALYALGLRLPGEALSWFNVEAVAGSLTMSSFVLG